MRILVAEDDPRLSAQIKTALASDGRSVDVANRGEDVLHLGATEPYDLVVLDIGLPDIDGISILRSWRKKEIRTPVLILTARGSWSERIDGLDAGADDYVVKPFHMPELSARVRALLRRAAGVAATKISIGDVDHDMRNGDVLRSGKKVQLTAQETSVLEYLLHRRGEFVSGVEISEHVYEFDDEADSNTIAVFIARLRKKLGKSLIETRRGFGYRIPSEA